jgi:hypothetical protein
MHREHNKVSPYVSDAMVSVLVLFENPTDELNQPLTHTDPTNQFLMTREWMFENGMFIPRSPE